MKQRCLNPNARAFHHYGGRGISVCGEWVDSFELFREWAEVSGWRIGLEIDRIDNNGPYSPDNCRWVTRQQNCSNTRRSLLLELHGETITVSEAARRYGVNAPSITKRLSRGWTPEQAVERLSVWEARRLFLERTSRRIEQADKGNREADRVARQIEEAPVTPDCKTPDVILKADI